MKNHKKQNEPFSNLLNTSESSLTIGKSFAEKTLSHIGVVGMRWGVRRSRSAKYAAKAEKRAERKKLDGKANVKNMTDAEIKSVINRIKLEQEYTKLTTVPSRFEKGKAAAGKIMGEIGKASVKAIADSYVKPLVEKAMLDKTKASAVKNIKTTLPPPPGGWKLPVGSKLPPPRIPPIPSN